MRRDQSLGYSGRLEEAARARVKKADLQQLGCNLRRSRLSRDSACDRNGWTSKRLLRHIRRQPIHSRRDGNYSVRERLQQPAIGLP